MSWSMPLVGKFYCPPFGFLTYVPSGLVADEAEDEIRFHATYSHNLAASSISSLQEESTDPSQDLFDFSAYMDQVRHYI